MNKPRNHQPRLIRWMLLFLAIGLMGLAESGSIAAAQSTSSKDAPTSNWGKPQDPNQAEPFWGEHQGGIATKPQHFMYFAAFDLTANSREDVIKLLKAWTAAAARMSEGETAQPLESGLKLAVTPAAPKGGDADETPDTGPRAADTGEVLGMPPSRLTITFGFGAGLFLIDGKDRFGLAARRPEALVDMPNFGSIDQMVKEHTGGDLAIQVCAEDPQVAFHAVRQLARIAEGVAQIRWVQTGYRPIAGDRHLLGFSAEEKTPGMNAPQAQAIWAGKEGQDWMRGGSYVVVRRIRFALEHWDQMPQAYQESAVGEMKHPSKPVGQVQTNGKSSSDNVVTEDNTPPHLAIVIPGRDAMLRRSYSYNDGVNFTTERWPPWRQGLEYDAGMFFVCFQRDPRTGFIAVFRELASHDSRLNQFWTHVGGGLFAVPPGAKQGEYIGQGLFESH
jgi:deferrochelatase/peroxidase EfeB